MAGRRMETEGGRTAKVSLRIEKVYCRTWEEKEGRRIGMGDRGIELGDGAAWNVWNRRRKDRFRQRK